MDIDRDTYDELPPNEATIMPPPGMYSRAGLTDCGDDGAGARATKTIEHVNRMAGELALAMQVIDALLELIEHMGGTCGVSLDYERTDQRTLATITRVGRTYEVRRRT